MKRIPDYMSKEEWLKHGEEFEDNFDNPPEEETNDKVDLAHDSKVTIFVKKPEELEEGMIEEISFLINTIGHYKDKKTGKFIGPETVDRISASEWVAYALDSNNIPVACVVFTDTTEEHWSGIISRHYYELKAGKSLKGKLERQMFSVAEEYINTNVGSELERIIQDQIKDIYAVSVLEKVEDTKFLLQNGYDLISEFPSDITDNYLGLWVLDNAS